MIKLALMLSLIAVIGCSSDVPRFASGEATALVKQHIVERFECYGGDDTYPSDTPRHDAGYDESYAGDGVWDVFFPDMESIESAPLREGFIRDVERTEWRVYEATSTVELVAGLSGGLGVC